MDGVLYVCVLLFASSTITIQQIKVGNPTIFSEGDRLKGVWFIELSILALE